MRVSLLFNRLILCGRQTIIKQIKFAVDKLAKDCIIVFIKLLHRNSFGLNNHVYNCKYLVFNNGTHYDLKIGIDSLFKNIQKKTKSRAEN